MKNLVGEVFGENNYDPKNLISNHRHLHGSRGEVDEGELHGRFIVIEDGK